MVDQPTPKDRLEINTISVLLGMTDRLAAAEAKLDVAIAELGFLRQRLSGRPSWAVTTLITLLTALATGSFSILIVGLGGR